MTRARPPGGGGGDDDGLDALEREIVACRLCPRLVAWREEVGRVKRRAFADQDYWARPVPGFGDPDEMQRRDAIAVREPCVHWDGDKALFAMAVGAGTVLSPDKVDAVKDAGGSVLAME